MDLTTLDRRLPRFAAAAVTAACATVLATGSAVAVTRAGTPSHPSAAPSADVPTPSATPSPSAAASTPPPPKKAKTVADFLLPLDTADADFERVPDSVAGAGPIDLRKAAAIDSGDKTPSAREIQLMRDVGFVRGHSRVWDDGDVTAVVYVYEWRTSAGARAFVRGVRTVHERKHDNWSTGVTWAAGSCRTREGEIVDSEVLVVGHHTFIVAVLRTGSCTKHDAVSRVAKLQYQHAVALHA